MTGEAWAAIAAIVSSLSLALSGVLVARVNATKHDVGEAQMQAAAANDAAVEARDLARPTGNGYADESRAAWARIERQLEQLTERQVRTNSWLTRHLADHAQHDINNREEQP